MGKLFFERFAGAGRRMLVVGLLFCASARVRAQIPIVSIVTGIAKKVVMAIDLKVQQLQTQTIGLQTAEKELENEMEDSELGEIIGWVQKQKDLYAEYYNELWQVKNAISAYERIRQMISEETQIATQFKQMNTALSQDRHFTAAEVGSMKNILSGILSESVNNINQIELVIKAFVTQMADADRLRIIDEAGGRIDKNFTDMQQFYSRNSLLSLERAQDANDVAATKALYGLQ